MARVTRKIIHIDEEKCDGCGLCAPACAEGAIQIVDGKARLVSETYCDGLGACLGDCPQGAITMTEREADEYNQEAVDRHLAATRPAPPVQHGGCPGAALRSMAPPPAEAAEDAEAGSVGPSRLTNWPVQIHLVPPLAPWLADARLTIAADCVPFAYPDFHRRFLKDRVVLVGCPKLDDVQAYLGKLTELFRQNEIHDVEVPYMEVPCCNGLVQLVLQAVQDSGRDVPVTLTRISIRGEILESRIDTGTA